MSGRLPLRASADWPEPDRAGVVSLDFTREGVTRANALEFARMVLLGPLAEAAPGWPPEWPIDPATAPESARGDARSLRVLADVADLDEEGYHALVKQARTLAQSRDFKRMADLIARALALKDALSADDLRWLLGPDALRKYDLDPGQEFGAPTP
jgi:hypothetical protein